MVLKRIAAICFAIAFLMAIVMFTGVIPFRRETNLSDCGCLRVIIELILLPIG